MNKIKTILIDDDPINNNLMKEFLKPYSEIDIVDMANSVDEALIKVLEKSPDLLFLDIEMPQKNGFELVKLLNKYKISVDIIFVTAFDKFSIDAIKLSVFDYLLKPVDLNELDNCINRYKIHKNNTKHNIDYNQLLSNLELKDKIKFNVKTGVVLINPNNISHCVADRNYTKIYYSDDKMELVSSNLNGVEKKLKQNYFIRLGRSTIININFLDRTDRKTKTIILRTNTKEYKIIIPIKHIKKLENKL